MILTGTSCKMFVINLNDKNSHFPSDVLFTFLEGQVQKKGE